MKNSLLPFIIFITINCFAQKNDLQSDLNKNILLIGETHYVKEKYDEIKHIAFNKIDSLEKDQKIAFYFELPYTLNYAFNRVTNYGDTSTFTEWFNHLYPTKNQSTSYFWTDYKDMILELIDFAKKKKVNLELNAIDTELEFRRTAFILSQFENKIDKTIDSLLHLDYIRNDSLTRSILLKQVSELSKVSQDKIEIDILETLKKSLTIDCTICIDRDRFMLSSFMKFYKASNSLNVISLGLDHIISKHDFSNASSIFKMKYKIDTSGHQSFYELLNEDLKKQTLRIGILALRNKLKYANISKPNNYKHIINSREKEYIERKLRNKSVYRIDLSKNYFLKNLAEQLDYLIVYKVSHYK